MASLIPGYNYDIFISYRQKDNKGDRWVSEFVEALKTELESTFKEDVSVYFDENPHDRLQETHDVDKSLESKLKSLIFIPILSQTYCDTNSYAWQHEFLAFLKMVKNDRFGKDVKLRGGNVASRVLPIRIHDLEPEDVKLFEKETGSVLRALDFVFKTSTGVSRPLKDNEVHPQDNLNKTFYSDQINKVGRAIKEIILGMKAEPAKAAVEEVQHKESGKEASENVQKAESGKPSGAVTARLLIPTAVAILLILAGIIAYPKIFKRDTLERLRASGEKISIAVMPFQNMTTDTTLHTIVQNSMIKSLSANPEQLKVRQIESITGLIQRKGLTNYASINPSIASTISKKLDANVFIIGSITQTGITIRLNAQLINSNTKETFKPFQLDGTAEDIMRLSDSLSKMVANFLIISVLEKEVPTDRQKFGSTNSPVAYRYFIMGQNAFSKSDYLTAIEMYSQALEIDSNYYFAALEISQSFYNQYLYDQAKTWCLKVYKKIDQMSPLDKIWTNIKHAQCFGTPSDQIKYINQFLGFDDQHPIIYYLKGNNYNRLNQFDKAIPEFAKALEIYNKWGIKPMWAQNYIALGNAYHKTGQYKKEKKLYKIAERDFPDNSNLIRRQAILALTEGDTAETSRYIKKYLSLLRSASEEGIATRLAGIYSEAGIMDKAEEYFRQAISSEIKNPYRINTLAYFLIDKNRNIPEGLELVDTLLNKSLDNYDYLHTKGWGLYKQGKYQEAKDLLQKSWDIRREKAVYDHEAFLHLEAAKKAVDSLKRNN